MGDFKNFIETLREIGSLSLLSFGDYNLSMYQTIVFILGLAFIYVINRLAGQLLKKAGFFKELQFRLQRLIKRSLNYFIWIVGLITLMRIENINTQNFFSYELYKSDNLIVTVQEIFVFVVAFFFTRIVVLIFDYAMNRKVERDNLDYGKSRSVIQITKYLIWIVGIFVGIGAMGLKLTFIIASVSALLVGVGFGLQNIFNDFFSGIIILFDRSVKVNDIVQVGDIVGRITEIGIRTSKLLNRDNIILIIPNSKFTTDNVINWSHMDDKSRFNVSVGVAYGSDVRKVEKILLECAYNNKSIESNPPPFVRFEDFGESSLDFSLFFWTTNSFFVENIKSELRFSIDEKFRNNDVNIPFPQRDLHLRTDETK